MAGRLSGRLRQKMSRETVQSPVANMAATPLSPLVPRQKEKRSLYFHQFARKRPEREQCDALSPKKSRHEVPRSNIKMTLDEGSGDSTQRDPDFLESTSQDCGETCADTESNHDGTEQYTGSATGSRRRKAVANVEHTRSSAPDDLVCSTLVTLNDERDATSNECDAPLTNVTRDAARNERDAQLTSNKKHDKTCDTDDINCDASEGGKDGRASHVGQDTSGETQQSTEDDPGGENRRKHKHSPEFSSEACEYVRQLSEDAKTAHPPTVSKLKMLTLETLEHLLKYNDRPSYNLTKPDLAAMVLDYMKLGCPPRCPKCGRGFLRFSNGKKRFGKRYYWCPGFAYSRTGFMGCSFRAQREHITRIPWKSP